MNDWFVSGKQLRLLFSSLAVIASVAATKALIWPRWPSAQPLDQPAITKTLTEAGFHVSPRKPLAAKRNAELATSAVLGYSLDQNLELRLMRGVARRRFNFQTAFLSTLHPELQLKRRHLASGSPPYAVGVSQQQPALQTCLVAGKNAAEAYGVTGEQLTTLIDQASQSKWHRVKVAIGLQSNRNYECILIHVTNTNNATTTIQRSTWLHLLNALRPALQSEATINDQT